MTTPDPTTQPAPGDRVLIEATCRQPDSIKPVLVPTDVQGYDRHSGDWLDPAKVRWRPMPAPDDAPPWQALVQGAREYGLVGPDEDVSTGEVVRRVLAEVGVERERSGRARDEVAQRIRERDQALADVDMLRQNCATETDLRRRAQRERDDARAIAVEFGNLHRAAHNGRARLRAEVQRIADAAKRSAMFIRFSSGRGGWGTRANQIADVYERHADRLRRALDASAATAPPERYDPTKDESQAMLVADVDRLTAERDEVQRKYADLCRAVAKLADQTMRDAIAAEEGGADLYEHPADIARRMLALVPDVPPEAPQPPDEPLSIDPLLEAAWGIIANANKGDWASATVEWREAAERWREQYHARLSATQPADPAPVVAEVTPDGPGDAEGGAGRDWHATVLSALDSEMARHFGSGDVCDIPPRDLAELLTDKVLLALYLPGLERAAYARGREQGRADAAAALRHAAEQGVANDEMAADFAREISGWAAEVAERGEVPAEGVCGHRDRDLSTNAPLRCYAPAGHPYGKHRFRFVDDPTTTGELDDEPEAAEGRRTPMVFRAGGER